MKELIANSVLRAGGEQLAWQISRRRLRILCYHGICENRLAGQPWVPHFFVTAADFEKQLVYLQRNACVLPLSEAIARLWDGSLLPRSVAVTFDDGYANNAYVAGPLLKKYRVPATIFLSSAYIESGEIYPFLKLKLIRLQLGSSLAADTLLEYKSNPLDRVMDRAERRWPDVRARLTDDQLRTLMPMTVADVRAMASPLIEFGAHTHTHCILRNESPERREEEIRTSVRKISEWVDRPVRLFSYPNGEAGDFDDIDKNALRAEGVEAAVCGIGGSNNTRSDRFELRRYPVGLFHNDVRFRLEVTGIRTALTASVGKLGI